MPRPLNFLPANFRRSIPVAEILARINEVVPVHSKGYDLTGEWIHLESDNVPDVMLFLKLKLNWGWIAAAHAEDFALLHCGQGHESGVWLHHLGHAMCAKADYVNGCHQIDSWS